MIFELVTLEVAQGEQRSDAQVASSLLLVRRRITPSPTRFVDVQGESMQLPLCSPAFVKSDAGRGSAVRAVLQQHPSSLQPLTVPSIASLR